jgi:hypothetical protein
MVERAIQSNRGNCLIATAIKEQYPQFTKVEVDASTIRFSDRERGERYTYLTPEDGSQFLHWYDWGLKPTTDRLVVTRAIHIAPILRTENGVRSIPRVEARRQQRIAALEAKEGEGRQLTPAERGALTRMRNPQPARPRPKAAGPPEVKVRAGRKGVVVRSGRPPGRGQAADVNLMRGRNRIWGAKTTKPGEVFERALEHAVAERLEQEVAKRLAAIEGEKKVPRTRRARL